MRKQTLRQTHAHNLTADCLWHLSLVETYDDDDDDDDDVDDNGDDDVFLTDTIIRAVVVFAEGIFDGESYCV